METRIRLFKDFLGEKGFELFIVISLTLAVFFAADFLLMPKLVDSIPIGLGSLWMMAALILSLAINLRYGLLPGLYLIMAAISFDKIDFVAGLRLTEVFFAGFFGVWLIRSFREKKLILSFNRLSLPIGLFIIANFASLLATDDLLISTKRIAILIYLVFLFHVFVHLVKEKRDFLRSLFFFIYPTILLSLYSVTQFFNVGYWQIVQEVAGKTNWWLGVIPRVTGLYRDPNFLAMNIVVVFALLLAFYLSGIFKRWSLFFLIGLIPLVISLYLTASRSNWVAAVFVFVVAVGFGLKLLNLKKIFIISAIIIFSVMLVSTAVPLYTQFINDQEVSQGKIDPRANKILKKRAETIIEFKTETGGDRINAYKAAVLMAKDHPLFGVGVDRFAVNYDKYILKEETKYQSVTAHNIFLETLAEKGIFGLFALLWITVAVFMYLIKGYFSVKEPLDKVLFSAVFVSLIGFFTSTLLLTGLYELFFWFILGFAAILFKLHRIQIK